MRGTQTTSNQNLIPTLVNMISIILTQSILKKRSAKSVSKKDRYRNLVKSGRGAWCIESYWVKTWAVWLELTTIQDADNESKHQTFPRK